MHGCGWRAGLRWAVADGVGVGAGDGSAVWEFGAAGARWSADRVVGLIAGGLLVVTVAMCLGESAG